MFNILKFQKFILSYYFVLFHTFLVLFLCSVGHKATRNDILVCMV